MSRAWNFNGKTRLPKVLILRSSLKVPEQEDFRVYGCWKTIQAV